MKKIAHFTSAHSREDPRIYYKQCESLSKIYNVTLVVADGRGNRINNQIQIIDLGKFNSRISRFFLSPFYFLYLALKNNFSLIHLHDPELLIICPFIFWKTRIIFDFHEDIKSQFEVRNYMNNFLKIIVLKIFIIYEYLSLKFLTGIVLATPEIRKNYKSFKRKVVINNFPIKKNYKSPYKQRKINAIIYVGVITAERGILEVMESLSLTNSKPKFLIVGKCFDKNLMSKIKKMKEFKYVSLLGWKKHTEIPKIIKKCHAGIATLHPKRNYIKSQPTKIFEYMMSDIPIILSNFPHWRKLIGKNKFLHFVDPFSKYQIAKKIDKLCNNKKKKNIKNLYKHTEIKFSWENEEKKLINFYSEILS